jgi:laminin G domain protein
VAVGGATAYRFTRLNPDTPPTHPQHLVVVPDRADLDPGTRDYAVTVRIRTTYRFGNIIQKGQATVAGGNFKFQIPNGIVQCLFRGSNGTIMVSSDRALNDGWWHTVRCERTSVRVAMTVDGEIVARRNGWTGSISNSWPLSIGGKTDCDQTVVTCDYYAGDIDRVEIEAR